MNIFRILSSNDGSINEPNVSSFLAYLLDPNEDHGISSLLLQEILNEFIYIDQNFLKIIQYKNRITDLSKYSGYSINVLPELTVNLNNGSKRKCRDIDILLEISDSKSGEILYSICLENKITDSSINKADSQLEDELNGLENYYSDSQYNPEIYVIYLTPTPSSVSSLSFDKLDYSKKCHLYWDNHENSIFNKLIKIFNAENQGLIDPINDQASYLIKSFLSFIKTEFKSYIEERREKMEKKCYGKAVIDHLNDYARILEFDKIYTISYLRNNFSKCVLAESGIELHNATRNAHITLAIVNERNRGHYNVRKSDDERKNIFYYVDDTKKNVKLYSPDLNENIQIYFKNEGEIDSIMSKELYENNLRQHAL